VARAGKVCEDRRRGRGRSAIAQETPATGVNPLLAFWIVLLLAYPILELALLIEVGSRIGTAATLGIVIGTAVAGVAILRYYGLTAVWRVRNAWRRGEPPAEGLIDGLMAFAGAILLIAPGLITDAAGLVLVVPFTRRAVRLALARLIEHWFRRGTIRVYIR